MLSQHPYPAVGQPPSLAVAWRSQQLGVFPAQFFSADTNRELILILKALLKGASPEVSELLAKSADVAATQSSSNRDSSSGPPLNEPDPGGDQVNQADIAPLSPHGPVLGMRPSAKYAGISVSTMYELLKKGGARYDPTFPRPFSITERRRVIAVAGLDAWLARKAARTGGAK